MINAKLKLAALGLVAAVGLSACTDGYGYSGVSVGYASGGYGGYDDYYGGGYYDAGYPGYGGFGNSYYGWYNDFYYPGTGYYVYGRDRQRYRWNDGQRRYWEGRRGDGRGQYRQNWQGFNNDGRYNGRRDNDGRFDGRGNDGRGGDRNYRRDNRGDRQGYFSRRTDGAINRANPGVDRPAFQQRQGGERQSFRSDGGSRPSFGGNRGGRQGEIRPQRD